MRGLAVLLPRKLLLQHGEVVCYDLSNFINRPTCHSLYGEVDFKFDPVTPKVREIQEIEQIIWPLGLRWRARLLKTLGERLFEIGRVPATIEELTLLPGVGPYVAAAWLSFHGGDRGVLIDANVVRWICRMVGREYGGETRRKKWLIDLADRLTPHENVKDFNYAVLDFTMTICIPREPRCEICPIGPRLCTYGRNKLQASASQPEL